MIRDSSSSRLKRSDLEITVMRFVDSRVGDFARRSSARLLRARAAAFDASELGALRCPTKAGVKRRRCALDAFPVNLDRHARSL